MMVNVAADAVFVAIEWLFVHTANTNWYPNKLEKVLWEFAVRLISVRFKLIA